MSWENRPELTLWDVLHRMGCEHWIVTALYQVCYTDNRTLTRLPAALYELVLIAKEHHTLVYALADNPAMEQRIHAWIDEISQKSAALEMIQWLETRGFADEFIYALGYDRWLTFVSKFTSRELDDPSLIDNLVPPALARYVAEQFRAQKEEEHRQKLAEECVSWLRNPDSGLDIHLVHASLKESIRLAGGNLPEFPDHVKRVGIGELELKARATNCLRKAGVYVVGDFADWTKSKLLKIPHFGPDCLAQVVARLKEKYGIELRE